MASTAKLIDDLVQAVPGVPLGQLPQYLRRRRGGAGADDKQTDDDLIRSGPRIAVLCSAVGQKRAELSVRHPRLNQPIGVDQSLDPSRRRSHIRGQRAHIVEFDSCYINLAGSAAPVTGKIDIAGIELDYMRAL